MVPVNIIGSLTMQFINFRFLGNRRTCKLLVSHNLLSQKICFHLKQNMGNIWLSNFFHYNDFKNLKKSAKY